jgi:hypothetical protein
VPIALVSAAACGGNAFENRNGGNGIAGMTSAAGGSSATGGSGSSAGTLHGGVGGHIAGQAGSSATGGTIGHGGNASGTAGSSTGSGGSGGVDISFCTSNTQCEIASVSCCSCGDPGTVDDYVAINSAYKSVYNARCAALDCAQCPPGVNPGHDNPFLYFAPTCQRPAEAAPNAPGRCVVVDLRKTSITDCNSASDCALRSGVGCCPGCSGRVVALNKNRGTELSDLVCSTEVAGCPACAPIFDEYQAICTDGRCGVELKP